MANAQPPGQLVNVQTNSFLIKALPERKYLQYDVFTPSNIKPPKRQRLIHAMQTVAYPSVFTPRALYDGGFLLYTSGAIQDGTFRVHGSNQSAAPDAPGWYEIKISRTTGKEVVPAHVKQLMNAGSSTPETITATNLLQLLICQASNLVRPNNGRAYFFSEGKERIKGMGGVELWRGFYQAVRPSIGRMMVTVDTTVAAMYEAGSLIDIALHVLQTNDVRRLGMPGNHDDFRKLEKFFKPTKSKLQITTKTSGSRTKTIHGLIPGPVGRYEFNKSGTGPLTNIAAHYRAAYNIDLKHPETIGVVTSGKSAPFKVVIPLELCAMIPGQLYKKTLPPDATASVVGFSAIHPNQRLNAIKGPNSPVQQYGSSEFMVDAGMAVNPVPMVVQGRLLPVPSLVYQGNKQIQPRDGKWNVVGSRFIKPATLKCWGMINFLPDHIARKTVDGIMTSSLQLGMNAFPPLSVQRANGHNVQRAIEQVCAALGDVKNIDIIVVLLPEKAEDIRNRVKHMCDVVLGVRSQCLRENKLMKANDQYYKNCLLKINARLGGTNAIVDSPVLRELAKTPFMIFGADVAHPGPNAARPSVASLVWSLDMYGAEYYATTRVQEPRTEMITDLKEMAKDAMVMFGNKHKATPAAVFVFRDGVSESEFGAVQVEEIAAFRAAVDNIWAERELKTPKPKLTYIVVGKRHHVSFFPISPNDKAGDQTGNCRAGLVVDRELANPQFQDFYLQSHAAIKGTSRSGHYTVLLDENFNNNVAKLQELAFALCHVYAKATRSVSIPAPVYYADLACARGKFYIDPTSDLDIDGSTTTGGQVNFNLGRWIAAYRSVHANVMKSMYFI